MRKRSVVHTTREVMSGGRPLGKTKGKIGFHGGKVEIERPRLRSFEGREQALPSCRAAGVRLGRSFRPIRFGLLILLPQVLPRIKTQTDFV
jgi:hypothetical protein